MKSRNTLSDWITQRWVAMTGRPVDLQRDAWLTGPVGKPEGIGPHFFDDLAQEFGYQVVRNGPGSGLIKDFAVLGGPGFDTASHR